MNKIIITVSLSIFLLASCGKKIEKNQNPNVIFILADDLGYGDLGCYGNGIIKTPNIDKLAEEGVLFTDCYAGASVCSPSRGTLLTGLHTGHARIRGNMCLQGGVEGIKETPNGNQIVRRVNLLPQDSTIGNVLQRNNYKTCVVNKWHVDGFDESAGPLDRGFDEFYGWLIHEPKSHNFYPSVRWRNREKYIIEDNLGDKKIDHNTDRATAEAIDFLQRHKEENFFLYLAYNAPHVPLDAKSWGDYATNASLSDNDKSYAALITHMDECIGSIMCELQVLSLEENTIVFFASDNGGARAANTQVIRPNGKLRGWKGELYEGGIRVPMIVRMPDKRSAGKISNLPCYFPDILPTIVDMTDSKTNLALDGMSLLPEILNPGSMDKNRILYWEQYDRNGLAQAVRYGDWKLIRQNKQELKLYYLKVNEEENLAAKEIDMVAKLSSYMDASHVKSENWMY